MFSFFGRQWKTKWFLIFPFRSWLQKWNKKTSERQFWNSLIKGFFKIKISPAFLIINSIHYSWCKLVPEAMKKKKDKRFLNRKQTQQMPFTIQKVPFPYQKVRRGWDPPASLEEWRPADPSVWHFHPWKRCFQKAWAAATMERW